MVRSDAVDEKTAASSTDELISTMSLSIKQRNESIAKKEDRIINDLNENHMLARKAAMAIALPCPAGNGRIHASAALMALASLAMAKGFWIKPAAPSCCKRWVSLLAA